MELWWIWQPHNKGGPTTTVLLLGCMSSNADMATATGAAISGGETNECEREEVLDDDGVKFANLLVTYSVFYNAVWKLLQCCATFVLSAIISRKSCLSFNLLMVCSTRIGK